MIRVGDKVTPIAVFTGTHATSATYISNSIPINQFRDYAAYITVFDVATVTARAAITAQLLASTGGQITSAASSVVGSQITVCASGATQTNLQKAAIALTGTFSSAGVTAYTVVIDGKTIGFSATADSSILVHNTDATAAMKKLGTAIENCCSYLDVTFESAGATCATLIIEPFDANRTFDVTCTAIAPAASADVYGLQVMRRSVMLEFNAADITSTNSSYTHVAIEINSTGTVTKAQGIFLCASPRMQPTGSTAEVYGDRTHVSTVSSAYSS